MEEFSSALVATLALNTLLVYDFIGVPRITRDGVARSVTEELPLLLGKLDGRYADARGPPKRIFKKFVSEPHDFDKFTKVVRQTGHRDLVFSSIKYHQKPPLADDATMDRVTDMVAQTLGVECPAGLQDTVAAMYAMTYGEMLESSQKNNLKGSVKPLI